MFTVKMADHDGNHRCLVERNVPIALILASRWRDGAESLGMERTSCLCFYLIFDSKCAKKRLGYEKIDLFVPLRTGLQLVLRVTK